MAATDVEYRCFVGGLAWATDDRALEEAFKTYGEIVESKVRSTHLFSLILSYHDLYFVFLFLTVKVLSPLNVLSDLFFSSQLKKYCIFRYY